MFRIFQDMLQKQADHGDFFDPLNPQQAKHGKTLQHLWNLGELIPFPLILVGIVEAKSCKFGT